MTRWIKSFLYACIIWGGFGCAQAKEYEGIQLFYSQGSIDLSWLPQFLPYNPVILEAGAFRGAETCRAAKIWPKGRVIAFEPNPGAYAELQSAVEEARLDNVETYPLALHRYNGTAALNVCLGMQGKDPIYGYASSLLPLTPEMEIYCKGPQVEVPCVVLDDWCKENGIDRIDVLRLELEGMELPVLESSPEILKSVKVVFVKTIIHPYRRGMTQYHDLKNFLLKSNFVLLSHWFTRGIDGHAVFLSRELFDAYFKLSLGIYLEV